MYTNLKSLTKIPITNKFYLNLPQTPGVYIFWDINRPIYVGKAINLKNRVSSYFTLKLEKKTSKMISEAKFFSYIKVDNELLALLLEAKLIRQNQPQYNIVAKDDKHPLYIAITEEKYPRVLTLRKVEEKDFPLLAFYGPFPSSANVRSVLRMLRKIFPYSDHKLSNRPCLYSHIGLCKPCPSEIEKYDEDKKNIFKNIYLKNIKNIKSILDGKIKKVVKDLQKEMLLNSKIQNYEEALKIRNQITRIEYITAPQQPIENYLKNPNLYQDIRQLEIDELKKILYSFKIKVSKLYRIECYDISHISGSYPTASMVVFVNGESEKSLYRHFRVNQKKGNSDVDSLKEIIKRRKKHFADWGTPDLIIVDGGKPQVNSFFDQLKNEKIPIIGLAKRYETLIIKNKIGDKFVLKEYRLPKGSALNLMQRIRDEAHRFARSYHHKLVSRYLIS